MGGGGGTDISESEERWGGRGGAYSGDTHYNRHLISDVAV